MFYIKKQQKRSKIGLELRPNKSNQKIREQKNVWLKSPETLGPINFSGKC